MVVAFHNWGLNRDFELYYGRYSHFKFFASKVCNFLQNPNSIFEVITSKMHFIGKLMVIVLKNTSKGQSHYFHRGRDMSVS